MTDGLGPVTASRCLGTPMWSTLRNQQLPTLKLSSNTQRPREIGPKNQTKERKRRKKGGCEHRRSMERRTSEGGSVRKWEWATQWGAGERRERKEKELGGGRETVFILMCTQLEGSVSAIVPGLPVKTVRLLSPPHSENTCMHKPSIALTHSRKHVSLHEEPPKAFNNNNTILKALATTQQQHQHSLFRPASLHPVIHCVWVSAMHCTSE